MPNSLEADLLALINQAPAQQPQPQADLPDLDLAALMSKSAQREIEAVQSMTQPVMFPQAEQPAMFPQAEYGGIQWTMQEETQSLDEEVASIFKEARPQPVDVSQVDIASLWGGIERENGNDLDESPAAPLPAVEADLANLFMTGEAAEAQAHLTGVPVPQSRFNDTSVQEAQAIWERQQAAVSMGDIEFDPPPERHGRPRPRPEAPQPFPRPRTPPGPSGVVVAQVGANGQFQAVAPPPPPPVAPAEPSGRPLPYAPPVQDQSFFDVILDND